MPNSLDEFQNQLLHLTKILALVGAGLSVSSGIAIIPEARSAWNGFHPIDLQTPDAFFELPARVWQYYAAKRAEALAVEPNEGHCALSALSHIARHSRLKKDGDRFRFATANQNIDGLLGRANHCLESLHDIHGSLYDVACTNFFCNYRNRDYSERLTSQLPTLGGILQDLDDRDLPQCPACADGTLLRPGVVWYGESLPLTPFTRIDNFIENNDDPVDLMLVIGTSSTVHPANEFVDRVRLKGGKIAIFNTNISSEILEGKVPNTWGFLGDAAKTLPMALAPLIKKFGEI